MKDQLSSRSSEIANPNVLTRFMGNIKLIAEAPTREVQLLEARLTQEGVVNAPTLGAALRWDFELNRHLLVQFSTPESQSSNLGGPELLTSAFLAAPLMAVDKILPGWDESGRRTTVKVLTTLGIISFLTACSGATIEPTQKATATPKDQETENPTASPTPAVTQTPESYGTGGSLPESVIISEKYRIAKQDFEAWRNNLISRGIGDATNIVPFSAWNGKEGAEMEVMILAVDNDAADYPQGTIFLPPRPGGITAFVAGEDALFIYPQEKTDRLAWDFEMDTVVAVKGEATVKYVDAGGNWRGISGDVATTSEQFRAAAEQSFRTFETAATQLEGELVTIESIDFSAAPIGGKLEAPPAFTALTNIEAKNTQGQEIAFAIDESQTYPVDLFGTGELVNLNAREAIRVQGFQILLRLAKIQSLVPEETTLVQFLQNLPETIEVTSVTPSGQFQRRQIDPHLGIGIIFGDWHQQLAHETTNQWGNYAILAPNETSSTPDIFIIRASLNPNTLTQDQILLADGSVKTTLDDPNRNLGWYSSAALIARATVAAPGDFLQVMLPNFDPNGDPTQWSSDYVLMIDFGKSPFNIVTK